MLLITSTALKLARFLKKIIVVSCVLFVICEYLIYPIVLSQCSWPAHNNLESRKNETLRAMLLADTHLLGPFRGHWFDKLRREWQMYRAFQTAMSFFQPEVVFFLGDVFDEGNWVNQKGFDEYVKRFQHLFSTQGNAKTRSFLVSGNHDMGFHYEIIPYLNRRFNKAFNASSVRHLRLKGSNFILLNSMAMEMDGCFLCAEAVASLRKISAKLKCEENPESCREQRKPGKIYSPPILLQHFPMYRKSDEACTGEDTAPEEEKSTRFRENHDCLSKESSEMLLHTIKPRLIMSGHTHHHCIAEHTGHQLNRTIVEYSIPSFSWRNRNDPSFYLAIITPTEYHLSKCYLPKETTVYWLYAIGVVSLICWVFLCPIFPPRRLWWHHARRIFSFPSPGDRDR